MSTPPAPDPYAVLGVGKDATAADIKTAYRKLVLKCHPDKIKDETKRVEGQDVFQRVQQAYELLSDESKRAKHDQKAHLAEARKAADNNNKSTASPSSSAYFKTTSFEYRGGKFYEEKTFVRPHDDDDIRFTEMPPRASSRKYESYERKASSKDADEKKKKTSSSSRPSESKYESVRASKEKRSSRSDRAKHRDKERRREQSDKQSRTATYVVSEDESEPGQQPHGPSSKSPPRPRAHEKSEREPKSKWDNNPKYIYFEDSAFEYIQRSKASVTPEPERRGSAPYPSPPPQSQSYYQTVESIPGDTARRSSARVVRPVRADSDRKEPVEVVDGGPLRGRAESRKSASPPSVQGIRRAPRGSKEVPTLRRAETAPTAAAPRRTEPVISRPTKGRERYDSGYSSPGTPDRHGSPPKSSSKYTIVDEDDDDYSRGPRTVLVDPYKRHQSVSPRRMTPITVRPGSRPPPQQQQSRAREPPISRTESARVIPPSRPSHPPLRHTTNLFGEVDNDDSSQRFSSEQVRYSPKIRQEDIRFSHNKTYRPGVMRKESYAY